MNKKLEQAAKTLISMCTSFLSHNLSEGTFVSNLELYARECRKEKTKDERQKDSLCK